MKQSKRSATLSTALIVATLLTASLAWAQRAPRTGGPPQVTVEGVEVNTQRTPNFGERTHSRARSPSQDWLQFVVVLKTEAGDDKWLDELTVNWHVMIDGGETPRLYMQTSTSYVEIEHGVSQYGAVYVRPQLLRRYFGERRSPNPRNMLVYLEIMAGNVRVAEYTFNPGRARVPEGWWRSPTLTRIEGGLLPPPRTPFQWLDYEFYMIPKTEN